VVKWSELNDEGELGITKLEFCGPLWHAPHAKQ
jgi:hypothetical protein